MYCKLTNWVVACTNPLHDPREISVVVTQYCISLVSSPRAPHGEKQSGEQSLISWAYSQKVVRTNEIARSLIITCT